MRNLDRTDLLLLAVSAAGVLVGLALSPEIDWIFFTSGLPLCLLVGIPLVALRSVRLRRRLPLGSVSRFALGWLWGMAAVWLLAGIAARGSPPGLGVSFVARTLLFGAAPLGLAGGVELWLGGRRSWAVGLGALGLYPLLAVVTGLFAS